MNIGQLLSMTGIVLLFLTSVLHLVKGYPRLSGAIKTGKVNLPSFSPDTRQIMSYEELQATWLSFGIHLLILSAILFLIVTGTLEGSRVLTIVLAFIPISDAVLMKFKIKSLHAGVPFLALAGILVLVGQVIM